MAKKKSTDKVTLVNPNNSLIQQLEGSEYIKNPLVYSQIRGDFSLIQTNVLVAIAATMQDRINSKFDKNGVMGPLFTDEEIKGGKIRFEVPLSSLGVKTKEYASVHESCRALTKLDTTFTYTDENGEKRTKTSVIFTDVDVPTYTTTTGQERRSGTIRINMNGDVAALIFNQSGAYVEHLGGIVRMCRSPRTPRLYIYLSAWKKKGSCTLNYLALKEFLGVLTYNRDRSKVLQDKTSTWAVFHRDVLDPAKRELKKLADQGKVEFYFDYAPKYNNGRKRGNPDTVVFTLHPAAGVKEKKEEPVNNDHVNVWNSLLKRLHEHCDDDFFATWVTCCSLDSITDSDVKIKVPSKFVVEKWQENGLTIVASDFFGETVQVHYIL